VRTINGLYLLEPIDMNKSFKPAQELGRYLCIAKSKEKNLLRRMKIAKARLPKNVKGSTPHKYLVFYSLYEICLPRQD